MTNGGHPSPSSQATRATEEVDRIVREFTSLYHDLRDQTLGRTRWFGVSVVKTPTDIVVLQEIIAETRPELIIETGVFAGGSALLFASLLEGLRIDGKVIGVDVELRSVPPHIAAHPRIELIEGSSADAAVVERLREEAKDRRTMVDLDADHSLEHVSAELRALAPLVTPGCYLVVEDTWLGGRPVRPDFAPGPADAVEAWLAEGQPFEVDRWRERFLLTSVPGGYLRRVDPSGTAPGGPPRLDDFVVADGSHATNGGGPPLASRLGAEEQGVQVREGGPRTLREQYGEPHEQLRERERPTGGPAAAAGSAGRSGGFPGTAARVFARHAARGASALRRLAAGRSTGGKATRPAHVRSKPSTSRRKDR